VLDRRRRVLLDERRRGAERLRATEAAWAAAAREADAWRDRALLLGGRRALELWLARGVQGVVVEVEWTSSWGVPRPAAGSAAHGPEPDVTATGGGAALVIALRAHRTAVARALDAAVAAEAARRIEEELSATLRRLRALERRWIPRYRAELAELSLALDEVERDDAVRIRWALERLQEEGPDPATRLHEP
jgi:V/A-type H+-transporting ATPase subunit D